MARPFKRKSDRKRKDAPWYFKYKDAFGEWRTKRGCADLEETKRMANKLNDDARMRREGLVNPKDDLFKVHEQRPISDHLNDFQAMLLDKANTPKHASVTKNRAVCILEMAGANKISEIMLSKIEGALGRLREQGYGLETCNHYVRAVKAFSRWLHRDGRAREHVLAYLSTFNSATDKRRPPETPDRRRGDEVDRRRRVRADCQGDVQGRPGNAVPPDDGDGLPGTRTRLFDTRELRLRQRPSDRDRQGVLLQTSAHGRSAASP